MTYDSDFYLDRKQLHARGWTRTLVERFLISPDRWKTVDYWANYKGKATYFVERVMLQESHLKFRSAFEVSVKRRKLSSEVLSMITAERARVNDEYRKWLMSLTREDIKRMLVFKEIAGIFTRARACGYRTPHTNETG
jgi:hypothetical protein